MATNNLNLCGVLSETKRIINAHSGHFLALSVLFLLPLSFSLIVYPFLSHSSTTLSHFHDSLFFYTTPPPIHTPDLPLLPILYGLFVFLFSLCAAASITHSTFHGFYGRPVKFTSSIKSVLFSFFPLAGTLIITQLIEALLVFVFGGFTALVYNGFALLGFRIEYGNTYFTAFVILIAALIICLLIYLHVEWYLSTVIVVVESNWGLSALRRSSYLLKGMKGVAFSMIILFGLLIGFLGNLCADLMPDSSEFNQGWVSSAFVFQTVVYTGFMTILMLYNVAASAVLYMYCKALRGELAFEIAEEFASEYIRLPFDDGKVPHVVYVV